MKHVLILLCLYLFITVSLQAQTTKKSNPQVFTGAAARQDIPGPELPDVGNTYIHLQVGNGVPYSQAPDGSGGTLSFRFPWDVLYLPHTFAETHFDVSKGYYSDRVQIDWTIQSNASLIERIVVYRRAYTGMHANDTEGYSVIATLAPDAYSYKDTNIQGGKLYEYKVAGVGISVIEKKYITYITGIGYRNPTGVVTGSISFDGGSPVKDVVIRADPQGADLAFGSSLLFTNTSKLSIPLHNITVDNAITMQAWVKLQKNTSATLFQLADPIRTSDVLKVAYTTTGNSLSVTVALTSGQTKTFSISNFYPTGDVDGKGDDLLKPFSSMSQQQNDFDQNFAHLSVVLKNGQAPLLYLNGRNIAADYITTLPPAPAPRPTINTSGNLIFAGFQTTSVTVADGLTGNIDEVRLWNIALSEKRIRTDFKRYLGGTEVNLISYLRCDEKAGSFAYDISRVGFDFNRNHAEIINGTWTTDKPTSSQLGILGVTDEQGNYIISAIPYTGIGESYTLTPMFGVHQFEPSQQLVFIGTGSEVINKIDFRDISSFDFMGVVYYTTDGVFNPIKEVVGAAGVKEDGYNQYYVIENGNEKLVSKGTYRFENNKLYETPPVYVPGANIYVDGEMVLDKNKRPALTDQNGFFKIKVPIGEHYIEVRKDKHGFAHAGRFPAEREDGDDLFEFFEHQQSAVTFLDTTRVTLVGRVVGGTREAEKPIGFGYANRLRETYNAGTLQEKTKDISSINNIGKASITLSHLPFGADPATGMLTHTFATHDVTGEYRVNVLPLTYTIDQEVGLKIVNNADIDLLTANETVDLAPATDPSTSEYVNAAGAKVKSKPYHFVKSFTHRSVPVLSVISQTSDLEVMKKKRHADGTIKQTPVSTDGFEFPVYTQGVTYAIEFQTFEEYTNYDGTEDVVDQVPIADGEFNITNNLAMPKSEKIVVNEQDPSISKYTFQGGYPSITPPFTRTIDIRYRVDGVDYQAQNYKKEGIVLGGQSDGSQTFVTEAPDVPDIILRDPPGSNSFASIEQGKSISFTQEGNVAVNQTTGVEFEVKLGITTETVDNISGLVISNESTNSVTSGLSLGVESVDGSSITKTYTFNQTISTSDDPAYVGSDGDLYIGNTKNYFYGSFDNVQVNDKQVDNDPSLSKALTNSKNETVYVSKQKAFYFSEKPSETFFIYSQKFILETLIPELQTIIHGIENGTIPMNTPGMLKLHQYHEQVRLWRKVIQDNEREKYLALYDRENYKAQIASNIEAQIAILDDHLANIDQPVGDKSLTELAILLEEKKNQEQRKLALLEDEFLKNVSFDAGVGEYSKSSEITIAQSKTKNIKVDIEASVETVFGFEFNNTGLLIHNSASLGTSANSAVSDESTQTTIVTYTLKDGDPGNFLSVDVINTFDGNGPIFSTVGGRTSCPYEGVDTTLFYNHDQYLAEGGPATEDKGTIYSGGNQVGYATQRVEVPVISVETASVTDVPEQRAAEFKLILENHSAAGSDANFMLYVDNTTNPHNAIINIDRNGTVVYVPYGEKVEYALTLKKSLSDVYEYNDIDIVLASLCDGTRINQRVTISAVFRPSCTAVNIDAPLENWVFNAGNAFNADNTTNPMNVAMSAYNRAFASFENFRLEYRKATSSSWTRLKTYYNSQALLDEAVLQGENNGAVISANTTTFPWDIGVLGLADGVYEIRAISSCANGTSFISEIARGTVDLNVPVQFGTPTPTDGILGPGEDLRLQFNENILFNSAFSKIQIQGETNQQEIDHNVTIHFEGAANHAVIEKPNILPGDFSMEFWMQRIASASGILFHQNDAFRVAINNGIMQWTFGNETLTQPVSADGAFHHYTLTFNETNRTLKIFQDDKELGVTQNANGLQTRSDDPLIIGGNTFVGNLHDLRMWAKPLTLSEAYAAMFNELIGTERDLVGYWPMNEGAGTFANDVARFKHAALHAEWDIKPKGTAYNFTGGQYLTLDDVSFVQLTDLMDITLECWIKTEQTQKATLFSNGRGNGEDLIQANGKANKWAVSIEDGVLYLYSEGKQYKLSQTNLADNTWHHIAIVLRRTGTVRAFIDAAQESSSVVTSIGGLSGNRFWIGARGFVNSALQEIVDEKFTGKIDELRLWNTARAIEQISRDRYNEVDFNAIGLMLYARMNEPNPVTGNGPQYYHKAQNETVLPSNAVMSTGVVSYTTDAPKIKQVRPYLTFQVSHVINGDEMILTPLVSDWSVLEGQILDITVDRMFDVHGNRQASPVTWTAYVRRNEMAWFANDNEQTLNIVKPAGEPYTFTITIVNKGGKKQPYSIENIPSWLKAANTTGTLDPNSTKKITFNIAPELTIGEYAQDLYLNTDFNFDEKIVLNVRVLGEAPEWTVDASAFEYSMNIIGKIRINGVFSNDPYTKIAAFAGGEIRGVANLEYDANHDEYFVYLNIFSNTSSEEAITFKIWDAATGKVYQATMNGDLSFAFMQNEVVGIKSAPVIFENTSYIEQSIALNAGWTWISLYAEDENLSNLNALTSTLNLNDNDHIKGQLHFDVYDHGTGWNGTLSSNGGLKTSSMYKVRLAHANTLVIGGDETNLNIWKADIQAGWNWLAYPLTTNVSVNEALALLNAKEGDVVKNQRSFAIYDPVVGWSGTLRYLLSGEGYMLKAGITQEFHYPNVFSNAKNGRTTYDVKPDVDGWQKYEHNMNVVAEVVSDDDYDSVFVMDKQGVVRGKSELIEHNGKQLSYITVFGNSGEEETLFFWLSNDHSTVPADKNFNFSPDMIMGNIQEPVKLSASSEFVMTVYPNMFSNELILQFNAQREQQTEIKLLDRVGRVVYAAPVSVNKGHNRIEIHPEVDSGLYILTTMVDGQKQTFKVIRK